jgi:hypothetical protein
MFQPHPPLEVETTFDRFITGNGGQRVIELLQPMPLTENADYLFPESGVIAELKVITKDFPTAVEYQDKLVALGAHALEIGEIKVASLFGAAPLPASFRARQLRLFRPPLQSILKKANRQVKATRSLLGLPDASGLILLVNDGLYTLSPTVVLQLAADILDRLYSGVHGLVYITMNQYVDVPGSRLANLVWVPLYSPRAPESLAEFVDNLGHQWGTFLESTIGPFEAKSRIADISHLLGSKVIRRR